MIRSQRKGSAATKTQELDFDVTQEIDPALAADALRAGRETTLLPGDFDDTEILLDLGVPVEQATRR